MMSSAPPSTKPQSPRRGDDLETKELKSLLAELDALPPAPRGAISRAGATHEAPAADRLEAPDTVSRGTLPRAVKAALALLPPSRHDGFSLAVLKVTDSFTLPLEVKDFGRIFRAANGKEKFNPSLMGVKYGLKADPHSLMQAAGYLLEPPPAAAGDQAAKEPQVKAKGDDARTEVGAVAAKAPRTKTLSDEAQALATFGHPTVAALFESLNLRIGHLEAAPLDDLKTEVKRLCKPLSQAMSCAAQVRSGELLKLAEAVDALVRRSLPASGQLSGSSHTRAVLQFQARYLAAVAYARDPSKPAPDLSLRPPAMRGRGNDHGRSLSLTKHVGEHMDRSYLDLSRFPFSGAVSSDFFLMPLDWWGAFADVFAPHGTATAQAKLATYGRANGRPTADAERVHALFVDRIAARDNRGAQIIAYGAWLGIPGALLESVELEDRATRR